LITMHDDDIMPEAEALEAARKLGAEHGRNAGTWAFDGNTTQATYERAVQGIDDGDPAVLDSFDHLLPGIGMRSDPDAYTARNLWDDIGIDYDLAEPGEIDRITEAYEQAARDAFWAEVERAARYQLADDEDDETAAPVGVPEGQRERWEPGSQAMFEYHCWESKDSNDADLWRRTHKPVVVISGPTYDDDPACPGCPETALERADEGMPYLYRVRFPDGSEGDVFEDELLVSEQYFTRPDYQEA
jgi:hypothetical protein